MDFAEVLFFPSNCCFSCERASERTEREEENSLGKNHFAIKMRMNGNGAEGWQGKQGEIVFVTNELPLKITIAKYTH
jgi:hypothetical protein